jgi:hypothetical protein
MGLPKTFATESTESIEKKTRSSLWAPPAPNHDLLSKSGGVRPGQVCG